MNLQQQQIGEGEGGCLRPSYLVGSKKDIHCSGSTRPFPKLEVYVDLDLKNVITKLCRQMTNSLCGKQTLGSKIPFRSATAELPVQFLLRNSFKRTLAIGINFEHKLTTISIQFYKFFEKLFIRFDKLLIYIFH